MRLRGPIADFSDALAFELRFDPALARRVRAEVEDHLAQSLSEAAEEQAGPVTPEAERRAVASFGDPQTLARNYAAASLLSQVRHMTATLLLTALGIFALMTARTAWYRTVDWRAGERMHAAGAIGIPIDLFAFALAFAASLIVVIYAAIRRTPLRLHRRYLGELRGFGALCIAALSGLLVAVTTEGVLTCIRFAEAVPGTSMLVPALLLALEVLMAIAFAAYLFAFWRRQMFATGFCDD